MGCPAADAGVTHGSRRRSNQPVHLPGLIDAAAEYRDEVPPTAGVACKADEAVGQPQREWAHIRQTGQRKHARCKVSTPE